MKDEYGRTNTRAQVIRNLANLRLTLLLDDIKRNPEKYPSDKNDWLNGLIKKAEKTF